MGRVESLCLTAAKGTGKKPRRAVRFVRGHGIESGGHAVDCGRPAEIRQINA